MNKKKRIGIDADGGDSLVVDGRNFSSTERILSALERVANERNDVDFVVYGNGLNYGRKENISLKKADSYFNGKRVKRKKGTSLNMLARDLKRENIDAFFSIGCSSSVGIEATAVGRINKVKPAYASWIPNINGKFLFGDIGGSGIHSEKELYSEAIDNLAHDLYNQGIMMAGYVKSKGIEKPRLGLFTNGTEKYKGSDLDKKTDEIFRSSEISAGFIDYLGKVEPVNAIMGELDILLVNGYEGNKCLKSVESGALLVSEVLKKEKESLSSLDKLSCIPVKIKLTKKIKRLKERFDPERYNGAIVLGYLGGILKGHGSSSENAIYHGIKRTINFAEDNSITSIDTALSKYLLKP